MVVAVEKEVGVMIVQPRPQWWFLLLPFESMVTDWIRRLKTKIMIMISVLMMIPVMGWDFYH